MAARAPPTVETLNRAVREVRRERAKAVFLHATVEAAAVLLVVNLLLVTVTIPPVAGEWPLPRPVGLLVGAAIGGPPAVPTVAVATVVALLAGAGTFAVASWWRLRRPAVERFEAANPQVAEALRTARDAAADGAETVVARALYADVLDRLDTTSSRELLNLRRLAGAVVLVFVASVLTVHTAALGVAIDPFDHRSPVDDGTDGGTTPAATAVEYEGLADGDEVLGEPEDVGSGDEAVPAVIESEGGPGEPSDDERGYDRTGFSTDGAGVDPQEAGFEAPEELEDADLIRRYNLEIRTGET